MAAEYVDPFLKQGFDGDRIRCGGCLGGLLILGSVGSAVPLLFVPIWLNVPSSDLIRWKPLPGRPPPTMTATLFRFDFEKPEWTGTTEVVPGFDWLDFCRYNVNDTLPVAKKLIEGTIFQPDPLEADQQVCIGATYACWLTVLGVLTIAGADLFILLSGLLKSILLLLLGGWLALLSAFALLLALAGLFLVDAKHLGTAPGVILLGSSVAFAFVGTTMALYQAMRATPDHLPKERQKWKEDDEELTEEEEKKRVQQILVECLDYDIPRLERYRVSMHILEECAEEEISYEEWLIEERLRMKTGKSRRAVLTEEELHKATVELRVRRRAHPALAQAVNIMVQESRKGRAAGRVPVSVLQEAFQGIDVTLRNRVTTREILAALKVCGIYVEGPAMDDLISWLYKQEEAQGEADTLDLPMFVALFNQVTDMLAKEMILKKAARGYQLTCRMAFLMNLVFLCVVLLSVTQEGADASWNSLLNVFGILFAIQFWSVIALPMLCSVLGKKAKVWRQHFCLQLLRCLSPLIRLCKRLCLCLCEVLLFIKGCCGLCKLCCGTLEDPDEEKGIAEETMSEGSRRGSIETGGRGSIESSRSGSREHGRRGSMEKQNRRSSLESGSLRSRRSSMEKGSRRSSMEKGSRRSSMEKGSRRSSMEKASRRSSMESGLITQSERSNRRGSTESSRGPESRAQRATNLRTSRLSADSGRSSAESYSMGIDDDLEGSQLPVHIPTTFLPLSEESEESGLFGSEGGDSVQSNVFEQIEKFKMERKQVRTPTGDQRDRLRSAGLAFKSEDEVFSYHVGPMRRPKEKDEVKEVEEAWSQPEPPETPPTPKKKGRRKHRRISAQQRSSAGNFFRSLVGSKEELTVVKELSINSQQPSISKASRRTGSLSPRSRLFRRTSRGSLSSGNSGRSRGSRKSSKGSKKGFFQRLLQRRRPSVEEPERYDPAAYQLAAMREQQMLSKGGPASFSPLQVRNLRAPQMMPPMVLEDTETEDFSGEMQSTTASWSWSKPGYNWSKTTGSFTQSREPTKEPWTNPSNPSRDPPTKELRSEEVT